MSSSSLIKMFELHIEAIHLYKSILSNLPCWLLIDPELFKDHTEDY